MNETSSNRWNLSVISDFSGLANQVATSGHFAPRSTLHAPRSTFAGVRPPLPRADLGIHGLNRWTVKCLEMSRKRGVQAARNGPSPSPYVAGPAMSMADRLGSRERAARA